MKGFTKRLWTMVLCAFLLCVWIIPVSATTASNCPGNCSHQAAVGTTHYNTLADAVTDVLSGSTVTLLTNAHLHTPITVSKAMTLDLGGNTLTADLTAPQLAAIHFTADGTVRNGKMVVATGSALRVTGCSLTVEEDAELESMGSAPLLSVTATKDLISRLTVSGQLRSTKTATVIDATASEGSCEVTVLENAKLSAAKGTAISFDSAGKLEISGGTVLAKEDAIYVTVAKDRETQLSVTDGKIISQEGQIAALIPQKDAAVPKDFITGGTFYPTPAAFIPSGSTLIANLNGTFTVVSEDLQAHTHTGGSATCIRKAVCSICGNTYGSYGSHNLISAEVTAPTCTEPGMNAHTRCSHCGSTFQNGISVTASSLAVPALGHDWENIEGTPPTCTEAGRKAHRMCKTCEAIQADGKDTTAEELVIPPVNHDLEVVESRQATCKEAGIQAHEHCSLCDGIFLNKKPVSAADITTASASHLLSDWQQDADYHWKACVDCQEVFRQSIHTDKDADNVCDDCGYDILSSGTAHSAETSGFSFLFLIPVIAAVAISVPLTLKKRKTA